MSHTKSSTAPAEQGSVHVRQFCGTDKVLFALILTWTFLACCFPLYDTDFWWHLRTGELILERGELPSVDWYTFMDWDKPWIDLHWGYQLLITGLYHLGGSPLVVVVKAAILTTAVGLTMSATGQSMPMWLRGLIWLPAIIAVSGRGYERPEMLSQLFLAGWLWIAHRVDKRPKLIWLLPVIQILWINCHALFILGLVVGGCYAVDWVVREVANGRWGLSRPTDDPSLQLLLWAGAATLLAALCNPYFEQGALFPLELYRKFSVEQDFYSVRIGEFGQPVSFLYRIGPRAFLNMYFTAELVIWCLTAASFVWLLCLGRWSVFRVLLFGGFSHLAWEATRNTNVFALVATTMLCANCDDIFRLSNRTWAPAGPWSRSNVAVGGLFSLLCLCVVTGWWNEHGEKNKPFGFGEARDWFAHDACRFAAQPGFPDHAFIAHIGQAAVYIYHNGPGHRVFMDGRLEVCSRKTFELFDQIRHRMATGDRSWEQMLPRDDQGRLPVVILDAMGSRREINGLLQTPGWRLVYADAVATVFLNEPLAQKLGLPPASIAPLIKPRSR